MKTRMTALELILHLAEGSTTPNTLQHITKIAREALEAAAQQESVATLYGSLPVYDKPAQQDLPDLIAGALGVSRGTAYDMMREALAEQPAPAQEPDPDELTIAYLDGMGAGKKRKPLTDEQIEVIEDGIWKSEFFDDTERQANREFARAIEAAHGITKGDQNMNQFTYGKAISGGEHNMTQKQVQEQEKYKSQIERQCVEMQATIDLLKATVETLHMRLKPVMADAPMRTASNELAPVASPLGLSINQYRQQTTAVIDELANIIESLEI